MHRGYIKLWRKICDSPFWKEKRTFSRAEAWIDMLMLANHKKGHIRKRGIRVEVDRGELAWSEVELSLRWKWSRGKVRRFLAELSSNSVQQIEPITEQQNKNVTSRYRILNYHQYQGNDTANDTANDTEDGQQTDSKRYRNKNVKNEKNVKNNIIEQYSWLDVALWEDFRKHRKKLRSPLTERAEKIILDKLDKLNSGADRNQYIAKSIERGWKGVFTESEDNNAGDKRYTGKSDGGSGKGKDGKGKYSHLG